MCDHQDRCHEGRGEGLGFPGGFPAALTPPVFIAFDIFTVFFNHIVCGRPSFKSFDIRIFRMEKQGTDVCPMAAPRCFRPRSLGQVSGGAAFMPTRRPARGAWAGPWDAESWTNGRGTL